MDALPIDQQLPGIVEALRTSPSLVLVADPGAGKTTRVPRALLDGGFAEAGEIVVLEPRRLAARMAARWVAGELGEKVGERVGYQVRFDDVSSARTRVRFVTEGILTRRLAGDPRLDGVAAVVLDEFHERHLHGDLALALVRRLQATVRPELRVVVMSATLDAEPVARFLGCAVVRVPGRRFEVAIEHLSAPDERPLEKQVAGALRGLAKGGLDGDVLVFLPGAAEIRRAGEACAEVARSANLAVVALHGDLPAEEQERAIAPAAEGRRKVILSTNVAETSLTIAGVVAVIDSGLSRVARHSPWSGLPSLETAKISRASATQRAGRAGRTRPGRCIRLYTSHDHDGRPAHDAPEVQRTDLAETVLSLRASGIDPRPGPTGFGWFEAPPVASLEAADKLLVRLGAVDGAGVVSEVGRRMLALPLHPRLARMVIEASARGVGRSGCLLAALLQEREIRVAARTRLVGGPARSDEVGSSDLLARREAFEAASAGGLRPDRIRAHGLDVGAVLAVARGRDQIARALGSDGKEVRGGTTGTPTSFTASAELSRREPRGTLTSFTASAELSRREPRGTAEEVGLLCATLAGFPDRVAKRRVKNGSEVVFAEGGSAKLAETSVVREAEWLVAVEADERKGGAPSVGQRAGAVIRVASAIEPEWLLDLFSARIVERREARFDAQTGRVELISSIGYDGLILDESRRNDVTGKEVSQALAEAAVRAGVDAFCVAEELAALRARVEFLAAAGDGAPLDDAAVQEVLIALCDGRRSFAELREASLVEALRARIEPARRGRLERLAPDKVMLPGGRRTAVHYRAGQSPWIESRLQDFFGLEDGPRIADGRVALVIHLLAPNQRALQVTTDLAGFWERHYPALRRQLMRRYPKHSWPEDPLRASPPARR
ncbi:MAG: ATP-dependent helicase HrpB [Myxococcales bacterium]|nr:ATP-dependent helicase HrpB [Myxococcales bacterium]